MLRNLCRNEPSVSSQSTSGRSVSRESVIRSNFLCLIAIAFVSITLNISVLAFIASSKPIYLRDFRASVSSDARQYVLLGRNFFLRGAYSREAHAPYRPDIDRPPLYPLIAGGTTVLFDAIWPLYVFQMVLSLGTSILLYLLTSLVFSRPAGLLVCLVHASEPTLAFLNSQPLTEPSFVFLTALGLFLWVRAILPPADRSPSYTCFVLSGLALGLATLIRPTSLYLPILIFVIHTAILLRRKALAQIARPVILFLTAYALIIPWVVRNHTVFGVWRYTTVDSLNLVYYVGAGVYQKQFAIPTFEEAQARVAFDYHLVPATIAHNSWLASEPIAQLEPRWRQAAWDIFLTYPAASLRTLASALGTGLISHHVSALAEAAGVRWIHPEFSSLAHGDLLGFLARLRHNHPVLIALFVWTELLAIASYVWTLLAMFTSFWLGKHRGVILVTLVFVAYFLMNIVLQAPTPDARMRTPLFPVLLFLLPFVVPRIWHTFLTAEVKDGSQTTQQVHPALRG